MTTGAIQTGGSMGALARVLAGAVVLATLIGSARSPGYARESDAAISETVRAVGSNVVPWCGYKCVTCQISFIWWGKKIKFDPAWQGQLAEDYGWTECIEEPVICPADNDECESPASSEDVAELWRAAIANDRNALASLVSRGVVELNASRRALQALGCGEAVIAHVPLTSAQLQYLTEAAANN